MPRYLKYLNPNIVVEAVEIDPDVIEVARKYLELRPEIEIFTGDGRNILNRRPYKYNLIVNDAFHGVRNIPFHLLTQEFLDMVKSKLTSDGVYAVNVIGDPSRSRTVNSVINTMESVFEYVNLYYNSSEGEQNIWILASQTPITLGETIRSEMPLGQILTDDRAPVEFLIAADLLETAKGKRYK
jgi:spermidine synthase